MRCPALKMVLSCLLHFWLSPRVSFLLYFASISLCISPRLEDISLAVIARYFPFHPRAFPLIS